jgi:hypothetical protein
MDRRNDCSCTETDGCGRGVSILACHNAVGFRLITDEKLVSDPGSNGNWFTGECEKLLLVRMMESGSRSLGAEKRGVSSKVLPGWQLCGEQL